MSYIFSNANFNETLISENINTKYLLLSVLSPIDFPCGLTVK